MRYHEIFEDHPRRLLNKSVVEWLDKAKSRSDADKLYIHGSRILFDVFKDPNTDYGQLIFASKLTGESHPRGNEAYQAEYYGPYLYLIKIHFHKMFRPYSDPQSKDILVIALAGDPNAKYQAEQVPVWNYEHKIEWGQLDYQDLHRVVPVAVKAGFDMFRVYEVSIGGESYGATKASMIEIVDILR